MKNNFLKFSNRINAVPINLPVQGYSVNIFFCLRILGPSKKQPVLVGVRNVTLLNDFYEQTQ